MLVIKNRPTDALYISSYEIIIFDGARSALCVGTFK